MSKAQRDNAICEARRAGKMIRFFLDGGNDTKFTTGEQGAACALAWVYYALPQETRDELIKAAGYKLERNVHGGSSLVKT